MVAGASKGRGIGRGNFYTREVHSFRRLSYVSQLKFYVLIGLGKPSTRKAWNYDWP